MGQMQEFRGVATNLHRHSSGVVVGRYHHTDVVTMRPAHAPDLAARGYVEITLDTGGWQSATTKARMNQFANQFGIDYHVFQEDWAGRSRSQRGGSNLWRAGSQTGASPDRWCVLLDTGLVPKLTGE